MGWSFLAFGLGIQVVRADREKRAAEEEVAIIRAQYQESASLLSDSRTSMVAVLGPKESAALLDATWARTVVNSLSLAGDSEEERAQALVSAIRLRVEEVARRRARNHVSGASQPSEQAVLKGDEEELVKALVPIPGEGNRLKALKDPDKRVRMV